nr:MAG TPA: hypothetical protein [Caudoviricetes sp.]
MPITLTLPCFFICFIQIFKVINFTINIIKTFHEKTSILTSIFYSAYNNDTFFAVSY